MTKCKTSDLISKDDKAQKMFMGNYKYPSANRYHQHSSVTLSQFFKILNELINYSFESQRETCIQTKTFHVLVHMPSARNTQDWDRPKPGAEPNPSVPMGGREPIHVSHACHRQ